MKRFLKYYSLYAVLGLIVIMTVCCLAIVTGVKTMLVIAMAMDHTGMMLMLALIPAYIETAI